MLDGESMFVNLLTYCAPHLLYTIDYSTMYLLPDGLILAYSFEENFGFVYGEVIKKFPCDIHQSVVALASFKGDFTLINVLY